MTEQVQVIDSAIGCPELSIVKGGGIAKAVVRPDNGARFRSFNLIALDGGAETVRLQHGGDAAYYVVSGEGAVLDNRTGARFALMEGSMVHIDRGDSYRFEAGKAGMKLLGGPCPADSRLYSNTSAWS